MAPDRPSPYVRGGRPAELADILWDMHARRHRHEAGVPAGLLEG
ncbi:hypothetical protein [Nonomuraea sp. bgisy101]